MKNLAIKLISQINFIKYLLRKPTDDIFFLREYKKSQVNKFLPFYLDRFLEFLKLYPLSFRQFNDLVREYDFPNTDYYKEVFTNKFKDTSKKGLFNSYKMQDEIYTLRLMLGYTRLDFILPYSKYITDSFGERKLKILDYGGGVSDIGLYFALLGHDVTLVELNTKKPYFAKKRFEARGKELFLKLVDSTEIIPDLNNSYDIIIATEILEHFRKPLELINTFYSHLNNEGFLLNSLGNEFERERGGDHLDEAFEEGNSLKYKNNYNSKFKLITGNLFKKVVSVTK